MEKMLQPLLRLRCQTFLEKPYLRNSALLWGCGSAGPRASRAERPARAPQEVPDLQTATLLPPKTTFSFLS